MEHFHHTRLRFAVLAVGAAGRSALSPWSPKQLFQPSSDWLLRSGERRAPAEELSQSVQRAPTPPRTPPKGSKALAARPRWRIA